MEVKGKITEIGYVQNINTKNGNVKVTTVVVNTGGNYPKNVACSVWGEKIDLSQFTKGDLVNVGIEAESRESNGKWYTNLRAWRISKIQEGPAATNSSFASAAPTVQEEAGNPDDLPF
jgi:hypothetical protein